QEQNHVSPFFLPDGKHFLYLRISNISANTGIYIGSLDAKPSEQSLKRLIASDFAPVYVPSANDGSGYVMFSREGTVMVQTLDLTKLELTGEPDRIADHVTNEFEFGGFAASDKWRAGISKRRRGRIQFRAAHLVRSERNGRCRHCTRH